jgi:hypothetical protein
MRNLEVFAAALLTASAAAAAEPAPLVSLTPPPGAPGHWSIVTGETVSPNRDAVSFELGWPGATFGYLHGLSESSDVGVKFDLLYSWENTTYSKFGAGLDVPFRLVVNRHDRLVIALHIDPGARVYTNSSSTDFFIRFPVGGTVGIQITPEVRIAAGADFTMAMQLTNTAFLEVGPQFGFGVEYAIDKGLLMGLNTRFGPQFYTHSSASTSFAFTTQLVLGYRL